VRSTRRVDASFFISPEGRTQQIRPASRLFRVEGPNRVNRLGHLRVDAESVCDRVGKGSSWSGVKAAASRRSTQNSRGRRPFRAMLRAVPVVRGGHRAMTGKANRGTV
jgi:DNA polymerase III epsilon subunit-like protein